MSIVLLVLIVLLIVGVAPTWDHSRDWGPYPAGGFGLLLVVLLILILTGRL